MRFIRQNNQPEALTRCKALRRQAGQPLDYDETGMVEVAGQMLSVTSEIRNARIADQGGLCAYTMLRIDEDSCHNEHIIPRSVSRAKGEVDQTLDYHNIVACYPKTEAAGGCPFGATARGTKPLDVSPMEAACEQRIRFDRRTGRAEPANPGDTAISELIEDVLHLNHATLTARRLHAFDAAGVGVTCRNPISESQARSLASSIIEHRRGYLLSPFCVAIAQAAKRHADVIAKRRLIRSSPSR